MKWIETAGGPLVLVSRDDVSTWSGYEGDYESACAVEELTGLVVFGGAGIDRIGLVIWGEPLSTTYLADAKLVVQWSHSDTERDLLQMVNNELSDANWQAGPSIVLAEDLLLFDAAIPGTELTSDDMLRISLESGEYQIQSADLKSRHRQAARVHRLIPA